ncbi:MAG: ABC transporter ATP-binding protein [Burkholderiales bacterium]|nr:ABC transporter ATP-binding protein [Burkholderiales bacterium]
MAAPVLSIENLRTRFFTKRGVVRAVDGVSFAVTRGQVLGIVGESGSGKSTVGFSIMGLIDPPGRIVGGAIRLDGRDLRQLTPAEWRRVRGRRIAMIFQDPMMTLNPVLRIDTQMIEAITAHERVPRATARDRAREALGRVGIGAPDERLAAYPHELSGGMRQRVAIAIALLHRPEVIIADEPTTALDVTLQGQILAEMQTLARDSGAALVWITHDLSVVAVLANDVCVMYAGKVVEQGTVDNVLDRPLHPYTRGLIASVPSRHPPGRPLPQIPGMMPSLMQLPLGCAFRDRCTRASDTCRSDPPLYSLDERRVRCFHPHVEEDEAASASERAEEAP